MGVGVGDTLVGNADLFRLAKKEMAPIFAAQWDRVVPCHGDVIETGGKAALNAVYGSLNTESKL